MRKLTMKYNIFIMHFLLGTYLLAHAMEKKDDKKLDIIAEITAKEPACDVYHITDDSFVVRGRSGKCDIIDWRTGTSKVLEDSLVTHLRVNTKNKKIILSHSNIVKIYDENGKEEWSKTEKGYIRAFAFHPLHNFLFICTTPDFVRTDNFTIAGQSYKHYGRCEWIFPYGFSGIVDFNPCKAEMVMRGQDSDIFFYDLSGIMPKQKKIKLPRECDFCKYSPDGTFIIAGNRYRIFMINLAKNKVSLLLYWDEQAKFQNILFYSNNVLVTIAKMFGEPRHIVTYWDINTKELIYEMPLLYSEDFALSISPHKKNVIIALDDKYVVMNIPFKVKYESDTKERFPFLLFALNHLEVQPQVLQDIVGCCKNILLELFKR